MKSKDQNYRFAREARLLRRSMRYVAKMKREFNRHDYRTPTLAELRAHPLLLAVKVYEGQEWLVEKLDYR